MKKLLVMAFAFLIITNLSFGAFIAFAEDEAWGDLKWNIDEEGTLTVDGQAGMDPFKDGSKEAWRADLSKIKKVVICNSVTSVGDNAFSGCENLVSVTIGASVTIVGTNAFSDCVALAEVTISENVNEFEIGESAFKGCVALESISLPDGVGTIGPNAFEGCRALKTVVIGNVVVNIGNDAFLNCDAIETVKYNGTRAQWADIDNNIGGGNDALDGKVEFAEPPAGDGAPQPPEDPSTQDSTEDTTEETTESASDDVDHSSTESTGVTSTNWFAYLMGVAAGGVVLTMVVLCIVLSNRKR